MKNGIFAVLVAAGVVGFVFSSDAQETKKLQPSPRAAADPSLRHGRVDLPSSNATSHPGEAASEAAKPTTGDAAASGGTSTANSKHHN